MKRRVFDQEMLSESIKAVRLENDDIKQTAGTFYLQFELKSSYFCFSHTLFLFKLKIWYFLLENKKILIIIIDRIF